MDGFEWCHDKNIVTVFSAPKFNPSVTNLDGIGNLGSATFFNSCTNIYIVIC